MIGQGVYPLPEAAKYLGVPTSTLRRWFLPQTGKHARPPIFESEWARVDGDFAISFVNLIEAYAASFFKKDGVSTQDIRKANKILKAELGVAHPFAHAELSTLLGRIIHEKGRSRSDQQLIDVISRQLVFIEFKSALRKVQYSPTTKFASAWQIDQGVIINPKVGFGKPVIEKTGISTLIVANQYLANRNEARIVSRLFNIPEIGVTNAVRFEQRLGRIAA